MYTAHKVITANSTQSVTLAMWSVYQIQGSTFDTITFSFNKSLIDVSYIAGSLNPTGTYNSINPGTTYTSGYFT